MVLAGQIIMGALQTQILQTSWYLAGDSFLCFQKAFYEGQHRVSIVRTLS